jgi:hypothetical protein
MLRRCENELRSRNEAQQVGQVRAHCAPDSQSVMHFVRGLPTALAGKIAMTSREEHWSSLHREYDTGIYSQQCRSEELAQACLVLRDAAWASRLFPSFSVGRLGIVSSSNYSEWMQRRSAWLACDEQRRLAVTLQEGLRSSRDIRVLNGASPEALREIADWVLEGVHG